MHPHGYTPRIRGSHRSVANSGRAETPAPIRAAGWVVHVVAEFTGIVVTRGTKFTTVGKRFVTPCPHM